MTRHGRNLLIVCLASAGWAFSFGLGSQVITHWLHHRGASNTLIGLNHSTHYLGLALGSLLAPALARRLGVSAAAGGMSAAALTLAAFPLASGPVGWFALRLLNGAVSALGLIPLETLISRESPEVSRTRHFALYAVALTLGGALGIWVGLTLYEPEALWPFLPGAALALAAGLGLQFGVRPTVPLVEEAADSQPLEWRRDALSYGTAWCQGFLEGGMIAFLSLYLVARGLSADAAGALMGATMTGVVLFQVPAGWLADRFGRRPVLLGCYALVLMGLIAVPLCEHVAALTALLFVFGAASGAMYPLGLALLGERTGVGNLARAYAWYLALECVGSQLGAAVMGWARDLWGEPSMFTVGFCATLLVLAVWRLVSRRQGEDRPIETSIESERFSPATLPHGRGSSLVVTKVPSCDVSVSFAARNSVVIRHTPRRRDGSAPR